jgi:GT2 family glycosyltransferase
MNKKDEKDISDRVSFVVVTWNGSKYIGECINAIRAGQKNADILVVDNGSKDASTSSQIALLLGARVVTLSENLGVAAAWNLAIERTQNEFIIFVNQDAILDYRCAYEIYRILSEYRAPCVVGAKLFFPGSNVIQHAGGTVCTPRYTTKHIGYRELDHKNFEYLVHVDYVTGAVFGCSKSTLKQLGCFDARFSPAYYEDVDFCWRVRAKGGTVLYLPNAIAYHEENSSLGRGSRAYHEAYTINRYRFIAKHIPEPKVFSEFVPAELHWLKSLSSDNQDIILNILQNSIPSNRISMSMSNSRKIITLLTDVMRRLRLEMSDK